MALEMETEAQLGDNRKLFRFLHKVTIIRERISEIIWDMNRVPVKATKVRPIGWKEFFETIFNHNALSQI